MKTVFGFPGQGSQYKGMGETLFDEFPDLVGISDSVLGYSIKDLCLNDNDNKLNNTEYTQPALYIVNALDYLHKSKEGIEPDYLIGHSLGEFDALFAAKVFDFKTGLKLVKLRAESMAKQKNGRMAAIVGLKLEKIQNILKDNYLEGIDIANINTTHQIILSGLEEQLEVAKDIFEENGATFIWLKVSGAFHSRYMIDAQEIFKNALNQINFKPIKKKVIANFDATTYNDNNIKHKLEMQIISTVRWSDSINKILDEDNDIDFIEIGPGNVLTKIVKQNIMDFKQIDKYGKTFTSKSNINESPQNIVTSWNKTHKVGDLISLKGEKGKFKTKTNAILLLGVRPVIYLEGFNGYFDLDDIFDINK